MDKIYVVFRLEWFDGELCETMDTAFRNESEANAYAKCSRKNRKVDFVVREVELV